MFMVLYVSSVRLTMPITAVSYGAKYKRLVAPHTALPHDSWTPPVAIVLNNVVPATCVNLLDFGDEPAPVFQTAFQFGTALVCSMLHPGYASASSLTWRAG